MLSKDHDPDDSASKGSRTKRRHDEDDGAGHLVEKATLMRNHSQNEFIKSENLLLIPRILVKGNFRLRCRLVTIFLLTTLQNIINFFFWGTYTILFFLTVNFKVLG